MAKLEEHELQRKDLIDAIRTAAGLEMRMQKRRILNEVENDLLAAYDDALARGKPFKFDVKDVLASVRKRLA